VALPPPSPSSTALVTGASSGIGEALARGLAERGHGVTLVARRESKLRELAAELGERHGVRADVVACDLSDAAARDDLASEVEGLGRQVEILVDNAGFGIYVPFAESDRERELQQVRVNCEAVIDLAARWLPAMVQRGRGTLIVTASTAAFQPIPKNATYAATKAFALSFAEAVHVELAGTGVTVTALCPGPVPSGFQDASGAHDFMASMPTLTFRTPEQVAAAGLEGAERGRRVVIPGAPNRVGAMLGRVSPRPSVLKLMGH
jgi:short-subunit dehydrogenase